MSEHTKGPWEVSGPRFGQWSIGSENTIGGPCRQGRQLVAFSPSAPRKTCPGYAEMFEANARLIAAAPELLEALEVALEIGDQCSRGFLAKFQAKARAAIAKARGKTDATP